jgi:hypothetical protein
MLILGLKVALALMLLVLCLVLARRCGPALIARYDDGALRVEPASGVNETLPRDLSANQKAAWTQLQQWCFDGAGDGRTPFWLPWAMPRVERRFSIAVLLGAKGAGNSQLAEAWSREIDGSNQLQHAGGAWARLCLRLRVKWNDCVWWRARKPADPWDSGYLVGDALALEHLRKFLPRRATLMVANALPSAALLERIAVLSARCTAFHHPVRLLIVDTVLPAALGLTRDADSALWRSALPGVGAVPVITLFGE